MKDSTTQPYMLKTLNFVQIEKIKVYESIKAKQPKSYRPHDQRKESRKNILHSTNTSINSFEPFRQLIIRQHKHNNLAIRSQVISL